MPNLFFHGLKAFNLPYLLMGISRMSHTPQQAVVAPAQIRALR